MNSEEANHARRYRNHIVLAATAAAKDGTPPESFLILVLRTELTAVLRQATAMQRRRRKAIQADLAANVANLLTKHPGARGDVFAEHIALLMALRILDGTQALKRSGLATLEIDFDPDESLPWHQRGLLDPELMQHFPCRGRVPKLKLH
jgi:hypothetical protein